MRALLLCTLVFAAGPLKAQQARSVITVEEIERAGRNVETAYDAVRILRPRWLDVRREMRQIRESQQDTSIARVHVFLNDVDQGEVEYLRLIPAERVLTLRWIEARDMGLRLGKSQGPVIVMVLRQQ
jgi:hypothetical protein